MKRLIPLTAVAALLGACATMGGGNEEYAELKAECDAKGGILVSIPGSTSPHDRANYACDIKQGSRVSRQP